MRNYILINPLLGKVYLTKEKIHVPKEVKEVIEKALSSGAYASSLSKHLKDDKEVDGFIKELRNKLVEVNIPKLEVSLSGILNNNPYKGLIYENLISGYLELRAREVQHYLASTLEMVSTGELAMRLWIKAINSLGVNFKDTSNELMMKFLRLRVFFEKFIKHLGHETIKGFVLADSVLYLDTIFVEYILHSIFSNSNIIGAMLDKTNVELAHFFEALTLLQDELINNKKLLRKLELIFNILNNTLNKDKYIFEDASTFMVCPKYEAKLQPDLIGNNVVLDIKCYESKKITSKQNILQLLAYDVVIQDEDIEKEY